MKRPNVVKTVLVTIGVLTALAVACGQSAPAPAAPSGGGAQPTATMPAGGATASPSGGGQSGGSADRGKELFTAKGCIACHAVKGVPGAVGTIGPALDALASRPKIVDAKLDNTPENLGKWLKNPPAVKPGTLMPNLNLSDAEVGSLVAFLATLK